MYTSHSRCIKYTLLLLLLYGVYETDVESSGTTFSPTPPPSQQTRTCLIRRYFIPVCWWPFSFGGFFFFFHFFFIVCPISFIGFTAAWPIPVYENFGRHKRNALFVQLRRTTAQIAKGRRRRRVSKLTVQSFFFPVQQKHTYGSIAGGHSCRGLCSTAYGVDKEEGGGTANNWITVVVFYFFSI